MRTRLAVLCGLLAMVSVLGVLSLRKPAKRVERFDAAAHVEREPDRRLALWSGAGHGRAADLMARLSDAYRLPADRRMPAAALELVQILRPATESPALHTEWNEDHWDVSVAGTPAGTLPEFPTFADGLALAEREARTLLGKSPLPAGVPAREAVAFLDGFMPWEALPLIDADAARQGLSAATVAQAAEASSQLGLLLSDDRSELADTTMSRALALLALARVSGAGTMTRASVRLAWAMGYGEEAVARASALPREDALRSFVEGRTKALTAPGAPARIAPETRVLQRLALAAANDRDGWLATLGSDGPPGDRERLSAYATALSFRRFDIADRLGPALLEASLSGMPGVPGRIEPDSATIMAFAAGIERPEVAGRGRLAGGAIAASRRALFASGLLVYHDYLSHTLASPDAMRDWSADLARLAGTPVVRFATWQAHLADAITDPAAAAPLWNDLADPALAPPCVWRTYQMLAPRLIAGFVDDRSALRLVLSRLDTRPARALQIAVAVQEHAQWPELTERLLTHAAHGREGGNNARVLLTLMRVDLPLLRRLMTDPAMDPDDLRRAMRMWVANDSSAAGALLPMFEALAADRPQDFDRTSDLARLLEARGRHAEAEAAVARWCMSGAPDADALDSTIAVTMWARLQREQGRPEEALRTIGDLDLGMQRGAMTEKAVILATLGRIEEAVAIAHRANRRYPQVRSTAALPAELYWRAGLHQKAAQLAVRLSEQDQAAWNALAGGFADAFRGRPEPMALALAALRREGVVYRRVAWHLAFAFKNAGDRATATALALEASAGSGFERGLNIARLYALLEETSDTAAADAWLATQHMADDVRVVVCGQLLLDRRPGPAWTLAANGTTEYDWVLRAAAWRIEGSPAGAHADTLRAHAATEFDPHYSRLLRYLLGEVDQDSVLAAARDPKRCAETWFFCAIRAWGEGRERDAMRWFTLCQETGSTSDGEVLWSHFALLNWCARWRTPEHTLPRLRATA